jgi:hypothetical protein
MINKINKVEKLISNKITFLGAGPMSLTVIDEVIRLANKAKKPIALIPSRRQIECGELGGGYVENWTTQEFSGYVQKQDSSGFVVLSRDHCGPYQIVNKNEDQSKQNLITEMNQVKISLQADIESGFEIIHIDPSLALKFGYSQEKVREIALELITFCESIKPNFLTYEIGTEEQEHLSKTISQSLHELNEILVGLKALKLPKPKFFVQQTGTKVQELRNVGNFDNDLDSKGVLPSSVQVPLILKMCQKEGIWLKEHNADYLTDNALIWHKRFGIHSANVAPEFGVIETKALLHLANRLNASKLVSEFQDQVLIGKKWEKWMIPESKASDLDKVLIAGHYHFSEDWARKWRKELFEFSAKKKIDGEIVIKSAVESGLKRYLIPFGYFND